MGRLMAFSIGLEHRPAHVCLRCPNFERSDVNDVVPSHFGGEGSIACKACFEVACFGASMKCQRSAMYVRCSMFAAKTQAVWVARVYFERLLANGTRGVLGSRRFGCHGNNWYLRKDEGWFSKEKESDKSGEWESHCSRKLVLVCGRSLIQA